MSCEHGYVYPEQDCASCKAAPAWEQADALDRIAAALERIADLLANKSLPDAANSAEADRP